MRLTDLAAVVELEIVRDAEFQSLGLLSSDSPSTLACLYDPHFSCECEANAGLAAVIAGRELASSVPAHLGLAMADDPRNRFYEIHRYLGSQTEFYGRDFPTQISPEAEVHPHAYVASRRVLVGDRCVVEAGATLLEGSVLEEKVVVRTGAVIGAEGFQPVFCDGTLVHLPHYGFVVLRRNVEIQSNSVICRSVFQNVTEIGEETKIAPLVHVAPGTRIGARCRITGTARILADSRIGDEVYIGPHALLSNRIRVGDGARISIGSVVVSDVAPGRTVTGNFAIEHLRFLSFYQGLLR